MKHVGIFTTLILCLMAVNLAIHFISDLLDISRYMTGVFCGIAGYAIGTKFHTTYYAKK